MKARIENSALSVPGVLAVLQKLDASARAAGIAQTTLDMVKLRASQINGCSTCADIHWRELEHAGVSSERTNAVARWREAPDFRDAERAALALTEAAARPDPVPNEVWDEAARRYTELQLAALVVVIATISAYSRVTAAAGQVTGQRGASIVRPAAEAA